MPLSVLEGLLGQPMFFVPVPKAVHGSGGSFLAGSLSCDVHTRPSSLPHQALAEQAWTGSSGAFGRGPIALGQSHSSFFASDAATFGAASVDTDLVSAGHSDFLFGGRRPKVFTALNAMNGAEEEEQDDVIVQLLGQPRKRTQGLHGDGLPWSRPGLATLGPERALRWKPRWFTAFPGIDDDPGGLAGFAAFASLVGSAVWNVVGAKVKALDPLYDYDAKAAPEVGWSKAIPRGFRLFAAADVLAALIFLRSIFDDCDVPLKSWLLGGIALGFPISRLVHNIAITPRFQEYRFTVTRLRGGGDPKNCQVERIIWYDQTNQPIEQFRLTEMREGAQFVFKINDSRELVTAYQLITSNAQAAYDPVEWTVEGLIWDTPDWQVLDQWPRQQESGGPPLPSNPVPQQRNAPTPVFEDLLHLEDATSAFRSAFLAEVGANAAAFAWLVAGTVWVSGGTETCVDSAPWLWYSCYLIVVLVWSFLGTVTIGLIVSAVAMVVLGAKSG